MKKKPQKQKKSIFSILKASLAFMAMHSLCVAPLIFPFSLGFISGTVFVGLAAVGTTVAFGLGYRKHRKLLKNKYLDQKPNFVKTKEFRKSAIISAGFILGAVFNNVSHHSHKHPDTGHDHSTHAKITQDMTAEEIEAILADPKNRCYTPTDLANRTFDPKGP